MSDHFVTANNLLRLFTDLLSFLKDVGFLGSYSLTYSYGDHSTDGVWWYEDASRYKFITTLSEIKHVIQTWESVSSINKSVLENLGSSIPVEKTDENAVKQICESLELEARELLDDEDSSRDTDTQQPLTPFPFLEPSKDFDEQIQKHTDENKKLDEKIGESDNYSNTQEESDKISELECPQCNKCFSTKAHLRRHIKSHTGERGYQCDLCERSYAAKQGLASHLLREHNLNTARAYPCTWCGKTFALKAERDKHSVVHSATKPFSCHVCERTFSQKVSRDAHLVLHTGVYPFSCDQCGKNFALQAKLNAHVLTHGAPRFQCEICEKKFARRDCLRQHLKLHAGIRPYPCETCGKAFRSNYALTSHQQVHSEGSRHMCDHCGAQFRQKSSLVLHMRRHTLEGLHTCTTCGKTYVKLYDLQRHSSSHSQERAFLCDTCGKDFKSQGDLQEHRRKLHNNIQTKTIRRNNTNIIKKKELRIYSCPSCPKQFKTRSRLSTHKRQHNEQPRYECTTCGKRFYRSDVLKNHMFLHTGNRPFSCKQCNKSFASQTNFKAHLIVHESNLQFTCDICGKIYRRQSSLNVHLKKHNKKTDDENNISHYECHICKRQFDSKLSLGGHLKSHNTNDRPFACVLCNKRYKKRKHWREHVQKSHSDLTELDVTNVVTNSVVFREEQDENNYNTNYNTITQQQQTEQNNTNVINTQYNTQTLEPFSSIQTDNLITQDLDTLHILQQLAVEVAPTSNVIQENQQNSDAQNFLLQCVEQTILADAPSLLAEAISAAAADLSDSLATLPTDATLL